MGSSFTDGSGSQVAPASPERKRPWGEVPAYHEPGSEAGPGVSQNVWSTARAPSPPFAKAGGRTASVHVRPRFVERNTVGPR